MRSAVIDIGSSSTKLIIGEKSGQDIKILESLKNILPIGRQTFFKGRISQEIINQTVILLEKYKQVLKEYGIDDVKVIATTAVREARNQNIFLDTIFRKTGLKIEVFNIGDVVYYIDSYLSYKLKETYPIHEKNILIAELGAGTFDISVLEKGYTLLNMGFPIGTLRIQQFKSKIDGSLEETYEALKEWIEHEILYINRSLMNIPIDDVILIDERYSSYLPKILSQKKPESKFFPFKKADSDEFLAKLMDKNLDEITETYKIPAEMADTIDGYALILNTLFGLTKNEDIYILETSLSEAVLANDVLNLEAVRENNKMNQLISVANFLCRKYNLDIEHSKHVADMAQTLFKSLRHILGLEEKDLLYLTLAAYLHDIGMFINNRSHHKHTEYIISALSLFRLTEDEIKIIAAAARYHRKSDPLKVHVLYNSLPSEKQILVLKLSALLKMANALDQSHKQKVQKMEIKMDRKDNISLVVTTSSNFALEKINFLEKKELFEEITGSKISLSVKD